MTAVLDPIASQSLVALRAGPLTLALDGPDLRYVAYDGVEIVRRVYMAVRDLDWNTIGGVVTASAVEAGDDAFSVRMELENRRGDIAFDWTLETWGEPDGAIEYVMRARARATFTFAKIGLNVHHPIVGLAGRPWRAVGPGTPLAGVMPARVHPQLMLRSDGWHLPLFPPVSELVLDHEVGTAHFTFGGDLYEVEDQRNWSDASYKTYSMPAQTGYVHHVRAGEEIVQRVRMSFTPQRERRAGARRVAGPPTAGHGRLEIGPGLGRTIPPIGLAHAGRLSGIAADHVAALAPAHLRVDIDLGAEGWVDTLVAGLAACARTGADLELALMLANDPRPALSEIAAAVREAGVPVARVIVFSPDEEATGAEWVSLVHAALAVDAPIGGGTNLNFCELNRSLPDLRPFELVAWPLNPQVHAFGDLDLVENLDGQGEQVRSARAFAGGRHLAVGPVSLRPRFNAVARPDAPPLDNVDPRQGSLLAAAWTLGSIKQLAEAGADSATYFETTGPRGLVDTGRVNPLFHVVADATQLGCGAMLSCRSDEEPWLSAIAVRRAGDTVVLVANLTATARTVEIVLPGACVVRARVLDQASAGVAMAAPAAFRARYRPVESQGGSIVLALGPYATARLQTT